MSAKVLFFFLFLSKTAKLLKIICNFAAMKHIIGLDAKRIVRNATGLGSYGRTLVNDLLRTAADDYLFRLYAPDEGREDLRQQVLQHPNLEFCYPKGDPPQPSLKREGDSSLFTLHSSLFWRTFGIVRDLLRDGVQLYHGLSGELPVGIRKRGIKTVVTIHDLIFLRHPEYYKWIDRKIYAWKFRRTLKEADLIIAISECTKRDIIHYGHVPEEKIRLVYQSCSTWFKQHVGDDQCQKVNARYELPNRYVIHVGTIEERKNILLAVQALPLLPEDLHLVVVGRQKPYAQQVLSEARRLGVDTRLHLLQGVPNADLPALYQMAEACVYPSRYEGFGIPIIEAIQSGLPVVACTGSCLEEAGGPSCLYVSPDDPEALASALLQVLKGAEGREARILQSQEYVRRFEGTDVASQVLAIYEELLS
jgi:glycosyltransferase involved in cell wall biosynthesis